MSEKRRVRVFFIGPGGELSVDFKVEPTVQVSEQEGGALLRIGGGMLEITMPVEILEEIRR